MRLQALLLGDLISDWNGESKIYSPCLQFRAVIWGDTNSTMKSFPSADIKAITMYIPRRKGMRLEAMAS